MHKTGKNNMMQLQTYIIVRGVHMRPNRRADHSILGEISLPNAFSIKIVYMTGGLSILVVLSEKAVECIVNELNSFRLFSLQLNM